METKLEQLRGELIANVEKEIRRRGVTNDELNGAIELPCYPNTDEFSGCTIERDEIVYMARIAFVEANVMGDVRTARLLPRIVIETETNEYCIEELYADDIANLAAWLSKMTDDELYRSRKFYDGLQNEEGERL